MPVCLVTKLVLGFAAIFDCGNSSVAGREGGVDGFLYFSTEYQIWET